MASRSVCWRAGRSRGPPVSSGRRRSSRASSAGGGRQLDARRRQLDRQRQAVQAAADRGDGRGVVASVEREVGLDRPGALDEEAHGRGTRERLGVRAPRRVGQRQRRHREARARRTGAAPPGW